MSVTAFTTPAPYKDLDAYIRSFRGRDADAWDAVKSLVKHRQPYHRLYSGTGAEFFGGKRFVPKRLAEAVMERHHLKYSAEVLWVYRDGVYRPDGEQAVKKEVHTLLGEQRSEGYVQETLCYIEVETYTPAPTLDPEFINLRNGRLEWRTTTLHPHTPSVFDIVQLPVIYDPQATCPQYEAYLQSTLDPDVIPLADEVAGHCVSPDTRYERTVMLLGEGSNGKSVFLDTLVALLGEENVSHEALQDLEENRFRAAELLGKLANVFADLDAKAMPSSTRFKMLTTGDPIDVERKFGHPFRFKNYARMLFSANRMPPSRDRSYAFYRRWIIIPFTRTFLDRPGDGELKADTDLRAKLRGELSGILNRALNGLQRLSTNKAFTIPKVVQEALAAYQRDNDTVAAFGKECLEAGSGEIIKQDLYRAYLRWCAMQGFKPVNQRDLKKSLTQLFPKLDEYRKDSGKGPWAWIGLQFTENAPSIDDEKDSMAWDYHE